MLDLVAGDDAIRGDLRGGSSGQGSCQGSEDSKSGREDSRLHFDVWFGLIFRLGSWYEKRKMEGIVRIRRLRRLRRL